MYSMRYLDDTSSLITIACCVPELRTIDYFPYFLLNLFFIAKKPEVIWSSLCNSYGYNDYLMCRISIQPMFFTNKALGISIVEGC